MDPVYRLLRAIVRLALGLTYARIEVHGLERLPARGPLLLLANHPNGLVDPMLVIASSPRAVRFVGKSTLFAIPVLSFFLRRLGTLPARRRQDPGWTPGANEELYRLVGAALAQGGAVGLFPEGRSHPGSALAEFRHGAARMALEAEAAHDFALGLSVVLVGIHFEGRRGFRGRALLHYAPPLMLAERRERHARDPRAATAELTAELQERLAELVVSTESEELAELLRAAERLGVLEARERGLKGRVERRGLLLAGYSRLKRTQPGRVEALRARLARYRTRLASLGLSDGTLAAELSLPRMLGFALGNGLLLALGLVPWLAGVLLHLVPFVLARGIARLSSKDPIDRVTLGLLIAIFAFPLWYIGLLVAGAGRVPAWLLVALLALGPFLGLVVSRWTAELERMARASTGLWLALRAPRLRARLRAERGAILDELTSLAELATAGEPQSGEAGSAASRPSR